jgi:hypothetical protein
MYIYVTYDKPSTRSLGNILISRKECQQESSLFCLLWPWSIKDLSTLWRVLYSGILRYVVRWKSTNISK